MYKIDIVKIKDECDPLRVDELNNLLEVKDEWKGLEVNDLEVKKEFDPGEIDEENDPLEVKEENDPLDVNEEIVLKEEVDTTLVVKEECDPLEVNSGEIDEALNTSIGKKEDFWLFVYFLDASVTDLGNEKRNEG